LASDLILFRNSRTRNSLESLSSSLSMTRPCLVDSAPLGEGFSCRNHQINSSLDWPKGDEPGSRGVQPSISSSTLDVVTFLSERARNVWLIQSWVIIAIALVVFDMCNISCSAIPWGPESTGGCFHARCEVVKLKEKFRDIPRVSKTELLGHIFNLWSNDIRVQIRWTSSQHARVAGEPFPWKKR
jgi:hypothetical protein